MAKKLQQSGDGNKVKKKGGLREKLNMAGFDKVSIKQYWLYSAIFGLVMTLLACIAMGQGKIIVTPDCFDLFPWSATLVYQI